MSLRHRLVVDEPPTNSPRGRPHSPEALEVPHGTCKAASAARTQTACVLPSLQGYYVTVVSIMRDCSRILREFVRSCNHAKASTQDQLPFELGQRREDAEHEAAGRGGAVDLRALTGEHPQAHAAGGEVLHGVDQMGKIATETVDRAGTRRRVVVRRSGSKKRSARRVR